MIAYMAHNKHKQSNDASKAPYIYFAADKHRTHELLRLAKLQKDDGFVLIGKSGCVTWQGPLPILAHLVYSRLGYPRDPIVVGTNFGVGEVDMQTESLDDAVGTITMYLEWLSYIVEVTPLVGGDDTPTSQE